MTIRQVISIFSETITTLQLCQCVRDIEDWSNHPAIDRVIMHLVYFNGVPPNAAKSFGGGIRLNDILDAELEKQEAA